MTYVQELFCKQVYWFLSGWVFVGELTFKLFNVAGNFSVFCFTCCPPENKRLVRLKIRRFMPEK